MRKNVAGQKIGAQMVSAVDGSAFAGAVTVYVTIDAGSQVIGTVGSGAATSKGNGYFTYAPSQAETNGDLLAYTFVGTGAVPVTVQAITGVATESELNFVFADTTFIRNRTPELVDGRVPADVDVVGQLTTAGLVEDSGGDRFTAKAVELVNQATTGDWSITRTFQIAGGDKVSGVRMSLVGVSGKVDTTGTNGIATIKADDGTFTLRVVVPAGYEDVADTTVTINGADSTATVTLTPTTTPAPPSADACVLSIYVRNQATEPFPGVTVTGRFPRGWSVADGAMNLNEVVTDTTDANGFARLVLVRDQEYDLSFARENGTIAKIRIRTPDAATATLNQSYQG